MLAPALNAVPGGAALLTLSGLKKSFGATVALDGAALRIGTGEILALMGANGAGKSTLVSILGGATRPDAGAVLLDRLSDGRLPLLVSLRSIRRAD